MFVNDLVEAWTLKEKAFNVSHKKTTLIENSENKIVNYKKAWKLHADKSLIFKVI